MKSAILQTSLLSVCALLLSACAEKEVSFKADIQPILVKNCLECHAAGGAGAEKSGPSAARADLYRQRKVVVTPLPENNPAAVARVRELWEACGAVLREMSPQDHDRVFAAVSHLPHLLAFGLVHDLAGRANAEQLFSYAASGFRDFTRVAGSHPEMWRDICVANRVALLEELDAYLGELARLRMMLVEGDGDGLEAVFERARRARNAWAEKAFPAPPSGE